MVSEPRPKVETTLCTVHSRTGNVTDVAPAVIPSPLPKWTKWALALGATPSSYLVDVLDYLGPIADASAPSAGEWRHVHAVFTDLQSNITADTMVITFDIANITNGGLDSSWTDADYTTVDGILGQLCANWMAHADIGTKFLETRYYRRAYNPYSVQLPFPPMGPPEKVIQHGTVGSIDGALPHQNAVTHTEITAYPKHWGRTYWPAIAYSGAAFGPGGLLQPAFVTSWATAVHDAYDALQAAEFFPSVPTTTALGQPSRQLLGVQAVQVDNVGDIVRRRRKRNSTQRVQLPLPS